MGSGTLILKIPGRVVRTRKLNMPHNETPDYWKEYTMSYGTKLKEIALHDSLAVWLYLDNLEKTADPVYANALERLAYERLAQDHVTA